MPCCCAAGNMCVYLSSLLSIRRDPRKQISLVLVYLLFPTELKFLLIRKFFLGYSLGGYIAVGCSGL